MPTTTAKPLTRMPWEDYRRMIRRRVKAGEHGVIIGSTGSGKSVLAREVVPLFGRNIVILDGKGGDDPSLDFPGFHRITRWPPPEESDIFRAMSSRAREPIRVHLAPKVKRMSDFQGMGDEFKKTLASLFTRKGSKVFALYVDEMQIVADPREGMGLGGMIGPLIRTKRYHGMSVITATQYPTWIPKSSYRETTHRWFFRIDDEESLKRLGEISGRRAEIMPHLESLRRYEFLYQFTHGKDFVISKVELPKA